ncbi:hypothetical protein DFP73DRAFT_543989 [Morchella snyderi]|nr:hypothetical protein DFP73DRAFT_543989 [Morchella snyderi]
MDDNDRTFKHLLFYQKEIVYMLGKLCLRVGNDSDSRMLVELAHATTRAITAINELRKIDQEAGAGRLGSLGVGRVPGKKKKERKKITPSPSLIALPKGSVKWQEADQREKKSNTDPREIPGAPVSQALVQKIPFQPVPVRGFYPVLGWEPPNGDLGCFERPRPAPSPPVSLPDTIDDEPDLSDDLDQIVTAPSGILMHPYPAGYYPSEAYYPLPIYHPDEPSLPLAATPTSMRSKASSLASESSASGFEARVHMLWERCFKAGDDDDDQWGCVWYIDGDEGESVDKVGGDTVDTAKNDVDASSVTGHGDEIDDCPVRACVEQ